MIPPTEVAPTPVPVPMPLPVSGEGLRMRRPLPVPGLPQPIAGIKPYCTPLSIMYNTGSICFDPSLFTINPSFEPWGSYVIPPLAGPSGQLEYSPYAPALLLQYCPTCAVQNSGLGLARGLPNPKPLPPPVEPPVSVQNSNSPVILVLKDGTRPLVSRYWLGSDWMLHFITVTGQQETVPFDQLDLTATGTANYQRGVVFSISGWPNP